MNLVKTFHFLKDTGKIKNTGENKGKLELTQSCQEEGLEVASTNPPR